MNRSTFKKRLAYVLAAGLTFSTVSPVMDYTIYAQQVSDTVLTVAEANEKTSGKDTVTGYIIGYGNDGKFVVGQEGATDSVLFISDSLDETSRKNCFGIKLSTTLQKEWGLKSHPELLKQKIVVSGENVSYYSGRGIKDVENISFADSANQKVSYKIKATPESGNVTKNSTIKLQTTTTSAILYKTDLDEAYRSYDDNTGITVSQDMTITAKFLDTEVSEETFTFTYHVLELDDLTIEEIRNGSQGNVSFKGIVTRKVEGSTKNSIYVQDATAGMYVYEVVGGDDVEEGDEVVVQGKLTSYKDLLEIENAIVTRVEQPTLDAVAAKVITIAEYNKNPDAYESQLITFKNVAMGDVNYLGNTVITDETGSTNIFKMKSGIEEGYERYDITTIGTRYNDTRQLSVVAVKDVMPVSGIRKLQDIIIKQGEEAVLPKYTEVVSNGVKSEETVSWNKEDEAAFNNQEKGKYTLHYTVNGQEFQIVITVVSSEGLRISDIQGAGHISPFVGEEVADIRGVVTALDGKYGFYMQDMNPDDNDATSEAIYVKSYNHNLSVGTLVKVSGTVAEEIGYTTNSSSNEEVQLTNTQIKATKVTTLETGVALPEPIIIGTNGRMPSVKDIIDNDNFGIFDPEEDFIDFYESLEGMLVKIEDAQVVGGNKYNEIFIVPNRGAYSSNGLSSNGGVTISENTMHPEILALAKGMNTSQPTVMVGDVFKGDTVGILTYNDGNYKIAVSEKLPEIEEHTYDADRETSLKETENGLRIASFNVENLGGTEKQTKFNRIAEVIVEKMDCPEIIGLQEVQDNSGATNDGIVSADMVYTRIIEAIKALNSNVEYDYVEIAPENNKDGGAAGGNIRVGMLYRKDRVQLAEQETGSQTAAVEVIKNKDGSAGLSLNPGRIDPTNSVFSSTRKSLATEFIFNGERIFVINNHLSSKGGDTPLFGNVQPATLTSEIKRIQQAEVVNNFVKEILEVQEDAKIVVLGDMNDYYFSNPVQALAGNELYNMHYALDEAERYTYSYQGKSQVLDNILVTKGLEKGTEIDILHINSTRSKTVQLSDHDPVMIRINMDSFRAPETPSSTTSKKTSSATIKVTTTENTVENATTIGTTKPVSFKDITNHWAQKEIQILASKGILLGVGENQFAPNKQMKACDFETLLSRVYDGQIVRENVKGGELLTRVQLAVILKNTFGAEEEAKSLTQFKDIKGLSNEETSALAYAYEMGLLKGVSADKMSPNTKVTRAQVATIMVRLLEMLEK